MTNTRFNTPLNPYPIVLSPCCFLALCPACALRPEPCALLLLFYAPRLAPFALILNEKGHRHRQPFLIDYLAYLDLMRVPLYQVIPVVIL